MSEKKQINLEKYTLIIKEGINSASNGDLERAKSFFLRAINYNSIKYQAYINLSNVYILQNKINNSSRLLFKYLSKNEFNYDIANHLAKICLKYNLNKEIEKLFNLSNLENKIKKKEKYYLYFIQGQFFEKKLNFNEAENSYSKSIICNKLFFDSYIKILNLLEKTNNILKLRVYIKDAFTNFNTDECIDILSLYKCLLLNREKKYKESNNLILKRNLNSKLLNKKFFYLKLLDIKIKNFENLNQYLKTFNIAEERNKILLNLQENKNYNKNTIIDNLVKYKKFYTKNNTEHIINKVEFLSDKNLVFLVGFPRSGTTLLDTILRSHSCIKVLEEKPFLLNVRHEYFKKKNNNLSSLKKITEDEKKKIRNDYYKKIISSPEDKEKIIIDKFPLSIIELGFIKCIFPNSKIIFAMRNPCDVVISCFLSSFKINDAMVNFLDWDDTLKFYNKILDLFDFYEKELKLKYYLVKYEEVIYDFNKQINLLLQYLGLKYEKELEKFYLTAKKRTKISTPSYDQVINPLYKSSIDRWKKFSKIRNPKKELHRWIKKYQY